MAKKNTAASNAAPVKRKRRVKRKVATTPLDVAINNVIKADKAKTKAADKAKAARAELKKLKDDK